ncbi:hypothetical protein LCGC14_2696130, partial [marine sediment metagenome]
MLSVKIRAIESLTDIERIKVIKINKIIAYT